MDTSTLITIGIGVAILGFLWNLHRAMAALRERMAKVEGTMELLAKLLIDKAQSPG